jgi:hypothetical protein
MCKYEGESDDHLLLHCLALEKCDLCCLGYLVSLGLCLRAFWFCWNIGSEV